MIPLRPARSSKRRPRRGVVAPLMALLLPVLLILLGFSIDLAHMQKARTELRIAVDNATRAAASTLSRTDSRSSARATAKQIAAANVVAGAGLTLADDQIEFGRSNRVGDRFLFRAGGTPFNSVRIDAARDSGSADGPVNLFFGRLVGATEFEPQAVAVASFVNVDIALVLDRSSSMKLPADSSEHTMSVTDPRVCSPPQADTRWIALAGAVREFTRVLRQTTTTERVAVVTYASDLAGAALPTCGSPYRTTAESTLDIGLTTSMSSIDAEIDSLSNSLWNGNTYIESGMRTALAELNGNARSTADLKMIVLTDGHENVGSAVAAAVDADIADVQVHTITFGDHADQATMSHVASTGGGSHQHASDAAALEEAFRKLAGELTRVTE